ncbi:hypothetical protein DMC14_003120 [Metamycoplasma phocicerebrale]|uniref:Metal transporter n=1 Tax=Metamycoplasma phocicerebrale TaxID=142649 RepID=A0A3T0TUN3_9BACT|nr:hypothetical protein [Metamycoplasma phocicerebrale]AZZ65754.1 hypothetical protein DMC14_003120 [Metamycoplasma phocicerebrale]
MIITRELPGLASANLYLLLFLNLLVYIPILVALPLLLMGLLSLIKTEKIRNNKNFLIYIYAFSTGMFLMLGAFGFLREGYDIAKSYTHGGTFVQSSEIIRTLTVVGIMGISALIGFSLVIGGRYLFIKKAKIDPHTEHEEHNHSDHLISFKDIDNPKAAWLAILLLLSHRVIDGFFIGYTIFKIIVSKNTFSSSLMLLITFTLHILFEISIVYFRQIQYGEKKRKAVMYNFLTFILIIPFIFMGAFFGTFLGGTLKWIQSGILTMGGAIIVFTSVFELIPEFIHIRNKNTKTLYSTFITFSAAIVITIILLSFHTHV